MVDDLFTRKGGRDELLLILMHRGIIECLETNVEFNYIYFGLMVYYKRWRKRLIDRYEL